MNAENTETVGATDDRQFRLIKIYLKDSSFESPLSPAIFNSPLNAELEVNLQSQSALLTEDNYEVILKLTVKAKAEERVAYLAEVHQAGIFHAPGFDEEEMRRVLGIYCPSVLYPYASQAVTDMVTRGGMPQLFLQPVNFDAIYEQRDQQSGNGQQPN